MHTRLQFLRAAIYSLGEHADALRSDIYRINHRQHWWIRLHDVAVGQCTAIPQLLSVPHCSRPHEDMLICVDYLLNTSDNTKYFNQRVCLLFVRHCPVLIFLPVIVLSCNVLSCLFSAPIECLCHVLLRSKEQKSTIALYGAL